MIDEETATAVQVALAYHRAWASGDFEAAMSYIGPDIVCEAPAGRLVGADAFRGFMGPFASSVRSTRVLGAYGDDETAMVMYDATTPLVESAPGAELLSVVDGRIETMRIVFDRLPFDQARRTRQPG